MFELDFEANLPIVRSCVRYGKRILFPSTSEVYGMCRDRQFDSENSELVLGPIAKQRWIYSCSKQLLDRVIWAYGTKGLQFTLFRPFNWFGPHLDDVDSPKEGSSRVLTQFLHNLLYGEPIKLVDGGTQRRSFTYISDGIDALMAILENRAGSADGGIFNIGNPANDLSIRDLAERMIAAVGATPGFEEVGRKARLVETSSGEYYGPGYQDILTRVPSIERARKLLGWSPKVTLADGIRRTLDFYLSGRRPAP